MAIHELNLRTIMEDLDGGRVAMAFQQELRRIAVDCDDRPGDQKPRKVLIEFTAVPVCDETGHCESIKGQFQVKSTVPNRRSKVYDFAFRNDGQLAFNDLSDDNARQMTIDQ